MLVQDLDHDIVTANKPWYPSVINNFFFSETMLFLSVFLYSKMFFDPLRFLFYLRAREGLGVSERPGQQSPGLGE